VREAEVRTQRAAVNALVRTQLELDAIRGMRRPRRRILEVVAPQRRGRDVCGRGRRTGGGERQSGRHGSERRAERRGERPGERNFPTAAERHAQPFTLPSISPRM
jgi:hypothetical protein